MIHDGLLSAAGVSVSEEIKSHSLIRDAVGMQERGADGLLAVDASSDEEHENAIHLIRAICHETAVPVCVAGRVKRLEDVKKYIYAGAACVLLSAADPVQAALLKEASERFGKEKTGVIAGNQAEMDLVQDGAVRYAGMLLTASRPVSVPDSLAVILWDKEKSPVEALDDFRDPKISGYCHDAFASVPFPFTEFKTECLEKGCDMYLLESTLSWEAFTKNADGLLPVIVQDFENDEVLMMAYMNEEAFRETLISGKMVYYSRSRKERWCKGETSGHYQYVRSLSIDCDRDTMLAKVVQVGAACHTGNRSCFYTKLADTGMTKQNPLRVFDDVYATILERKKHPKEGSYTNYLFDKGIDKILKKGGEECAETIIAAKNPGSEEIVYEISDYLYHLMVLMAEKGVTWEDITAELSRRH